MITLNQLQAWFSDVHEILTDIHVNVQMLKRLSSPQNEAERDLFGQPFFVHYSVQLKFVAIVELCKIFVNKDAERRNVGKLFNRLKYDRYDNPLKKRLKENRSEPGRVVYKAGIVEIVDILGAGIEENQEIIRNIRIHRDQLYVHSDPGKPIPVLSIREIEELSHLAQKVFNRLNQAIFGGSFHPTDDIIIEFNRLVGRFTE